MPLVDPCKSLEMRHGKHIRHLIGKRAKMVDTYDAAEIAESALVRAPQQIEADNKALDKSVNNCNDGLFSGSL